MLCHCGWEKGNDKEKHEAWNYALKLPGVEISGWTHPSSERWWWESHLNFWSSCPVSWFSNPCLLGSPWEFYLTSEYNHHVWVLTSYTVRTRVEIPGTMYETWVWGCSSVSSSGQAEAGGFLELAGHKSSWISKLWFSERPCLQNQGGESLIKSQTSTVVSTHTCMHEHVYTQACTHQKKKKRKFSSSFMWTKSLEMRYWFTDTWF